MRAASLVVGTACLIAAAVFACSTFGETPSSELPDAQTSDGGDALDAADIRDARARREMVFVDASTPFFIDAFEVTTAQFRAFKNDPAIVPPSKQPGCNGKTAYGPHLACPFTDGDDLPVHCVDWCDALAYCMWAGKRLCRRIGGQPYAADTERNDTLYDEWTHACAAGSLSSNRWPHGVSENVTACNGGDVADAAIAPVGSHPDCVGGFPGLYDMTGNVWEWTDGCFGAVVDFQTGGCAEHGGGYSELANGARCSLVAAEARDRVYRDVGFRCCKDP